MRKLQALLLTRGPNADRAMQFSLLTPAWYAASCTVYDTLLSSSVHRFDMRIVMMMMMMKMA